MNGLSYILNTQLAIVILYLLYLAALRKRLLPSLARIYLIAIVPTAMIISAIKVEVKGLGTLLGDLLHNRADSISSGIFNTSEAGALELIETNSVGNGGYESIFSGELAIYLYITGLAITLLLTLFDIYRSYRYISGKKRGKTYAFSAMGKEYIGGEIEDNLLKVIKIHERAHIDQRHHVDLIYMLLCRNIFWFNPAIWHINYLLKEVHEYQADNKVIKTGYSSRKYAEILINMEMGYLSPYIIHSFSYTSTKNRIIMLKRNNSKSRYLRILYVVPVLALLFGLICCKAIQEDPIQIDSPVNETVIVETIDYQIDPDIDQEAIPFAFAEVKPQFINENGEAAEANEFTKWVNKNLTYPKTAKENGIQGRVMLEFTVGTDGVVRNVKVLRGVDTSLDAEAVRVVESSPKWIPAEQEGRKVKVVYRFPVIFQLKSSSETVSQTPTTKTTEVITYINSDSDAVPFAFVEKKPQFVDENGNVEDPVTFTSWVNNRLSYPQIAKENGIQGRVMIEFTVEKDGSINDVKVVRGVDKSLDDEAVRVVKSSPKWIPGEDAKGKVAVLYRFPVVFSLE